MASSVRGQDKPNRPLLLATRADKVELSCPLGTNRCIPQEKFRRTPYNKAVSISVSGELRTYPSPNQTVTLTYYDMSGLGRGRCAVAQILILIHKSFIDQACSVKTAGY